MDWETAYEQCQPFGAGKGPYRMENRQVLGALQQDLAVLQQKVTGETGELLERYLKSADQYLYNCCRYYYYRGMLYGTRAALETWFAEYGAGEETHRP